MASLAGVVAWVMRAAAAADVDVVAELRAVVLRADLERLGRYDERRVHQRLRDRFEPGHTQIIEAEGAFAGCVALRPDGEMCWLEHFYLASHLQVLQGSAARRLYERHGFVIDSEDEVDVFMVRRP